MKGLLVLMCGIIVCVQGRVGDKCHEQGQCDAGECCQILNPFPIMSKRQLEAVHINDLLHPEGTCQLYKTENATCGAFEKANGYCGCGPGLRCNGREVKLGTPVLRSMIAPHDGYTWQYTCTPVTN